MDEYCGLSPSDEQSYHHFMHTKFFDHVDIKPENIHILNGLSKNRAEECANYEKMIAKYGPFQIFMGGIGKEGHIAFNESGSSRNSKTREIQLAQSTIEANSRFFNNDISKVPKSALTVGISTILDNSKEVIILAFGTSKADVVSKTINDNIDSKTPSTFLREHPNVTLVVDKSSALLLHKK
ncbi:related to Glucosamine-6-phosphate isomerase [Saccharomycodes ludwigii]|uniref:glucosamine-6-phosphate deaminase n=2 Tax=Saccharomycodes ludwigii TaxID=36035 RepID=A0A376B9F0_9ASCO|nr:related to Glucosamine-6-phosphate isomerase [Saccharomycodes ludwigii]